MPTIWVAVLRVSPGVRTKLTALHNLDADEVADEILCVAGLRGKRVNDERGSRLIIETRVRGVLVKIVLYPTPDPGIWNLGSAYPIGS